MRPREILAAVGRTPSTGWQQPVIVGLATIYIVTAVVLAALGIAEPWSAVRAVLGIIAVLLIGRTPVAGS